MKAFNINNYVKVKLTEDAVNELERQHIELYKSIPVYRDFTPPKVDENGYSKFQL